MLAKLLGRAPDKIRLRHARLMAKETGHAAQSSAPPTAPDEVGTLTTALREVGTLAEKRVDVRQSTLGVRVLLPRPRRMSCE